MKQIRVVLLSLVIVLCSLLTPAQQSVTTAANATNAVPPLIPFSSVATDEGGNSLSGVVSLTFSLYAAQQGGEPLWTETQNNVQLDPTGHYSVQLGITKPNGVSTTLFTTGEARWLGVQIAGQGEQPRVLLLSVPYALKAGDAATIGGLPPTAFVLAAPPSGTTSAYATAAISDQSAPPPTATDVTTTGGTVNFLPLFNGTTTILDSVVFQSAASPFKIGINTTTPATTLDVKGAGTIRGILSLPAAGTATATKGANSQPLNLVASAFNSTSSTAVNQTFQWQAEPASNDTTTPSGTLNLLFGIGATKPAETGLNIASTGVITFNATQTFPNTIAGVTTATGSGLTGGGTSGTLNLALTSACAQNQVLQWNGTAWACAAVGTGTVTSVGSGAGLTGGPITGSGTLSIPTGGVTNAMLATSYAQLGATNTFTANQTLNGTLTASSSGNSIVGNTSNATSAAVVGDGIGLGAYGSASSTSGTGVEGYATATSGSTVGVLGQTASSSGYGVQGSANATAGTTYGVFGSSQSPAGYGVYGQQLASTGTTAGVYGTTMSPAGYGVYGQQIATSGTTAGVYGTTMSTTGYGVQGVSPHDGVYGQASGISNEGTHYTYGSGLWGDTGGASTYYTAVLGTADSNYAGLFVNNSPHVPTLAFENYTETAGGQVFYAAMPSALGFADAIMGDAVCGAGFMALQLGQGSMSGCNNYTLMGDTSGNVYLNANSGGTIHLRVNNGDQLTATTGNVDVRGTLSKGGGSFKIDHPLDPANKYLYHSFVESPDMKNMYDGNITTDGAGQATVTLPDWFETLNRDFRYQLTVIGQFAQAIVASEISGNQFSIRTDKPNVKVSWQVTGTRQDAYANAHRIQVEVDKAPADRGHYLYPELVGAPETERIGYMAVPPGNDQVVHQRPALPPRRNAPPSQLQTPPSSPVLPRPVPPSVLKMPAPPVRAAAQPLAAQPK
jgi:trimeric autotransporter adhesin